MLKAVQQLFQRRQGWTLEQEVADRLCRGESAAVLDAMERSREIVRARFNQLSAEAVQLDKESAALYRSLQSFSAFGMTALVALWTLSNATSEPGGSPAAPWIRAALPYGFSVVTLFGLEIFAEIVSLGAIRKAVEVELARLQGAFTHVRQSADRRASRLDPGRIALGVGWAMVYVIAFYLGLQEALSGAFARPPFNREPAMWSPSEMAWLAFYLVPLAVMEVLTVLQVRYVYSLAKDTPIRTTTLLRSAASGKHRSGS